MTRARLAAIVTSSADAIIGETLDGIITDWNPAAERLYGYSAAEAIGKPLTILAPPDRAGEIGDLLERVGRGASIVELETVRRTKSGQLIDVCLTISPVRDDAGQIIAASSITRDNTERKAAEAERAATHQHTRQVLERITDGFYALGRDWRFTYVNAAAERMLGRTRAELLDQNVWEQFPPAVQTPLYAAHHQALANGITTTVELFYPPLDGWFEVRAYPSPDGLSVFLRDITASKQLEAELRRSEAKYRTLVEQIPAVVYVLAADRNQTPLYFSPRIQELTGEPPEEALALKEHWLELVHPDDYAHVAAEDARTSASGEPFRMEYRQLRKDGSYVWVQDECVPVYDEAGHIVGWQGVLLDIAERKRSEEALRAALEAAQAANRAKDQFLAMMSHELRSPLQAVLGYSEFLLSGPDGSLTAEQREDIGYIHQGGGRMIALISQLLDLSRLQAGRLEIAKAPVNLVEIIEQVRQDIAPQAAAKGLNVQVDVPPSLPSMISDGERLRHVLLNLLGNAVKFTDEGQVRITAGVTPGGLEVVVSDTGIGIPADALPHIFEEFRQVDNSRTRRHGGAGLGLAIVGKLVELMEGTISVSSEPQVGSVFTLRLPMRGSSA
jgi:PAS domain S-box-containing protein